MKTAADTMTAVRAYLAGGLSVVPIKPDGSKRPADFWKKFQERLAVECEVIEFWGNGHGYGVGILGGKVSGNLEHLDFDFDAATVFPAWCELVEAEVPGLVDRLSIRSTPGGGFHVSYRCPDVVIPGNTKLAMKPNPDFDAEKPRSKTNPESWTVIETRGEGGQVLAPGCPPACHSTGRTYEHLRGPKLSQVQNVTSEEREVLLRAAYSFDRSSFDDGPTPAASRQTGGLLPGDDYCERGPDWSEILEPAGWTLARQSGRVRYWRRPGKDDPGWSATTEACTSKSGRELLAVFSSNASPFPGPGGGHNCSTHNKFSTHALLYCGGDFCAAARELANQGYGSKRAGKPGQSSVNTDAIRLADLAFVIASARRTASGKLTMAVKVSRDGKQVDEVPLASSMASRAGAAKIIRQHLGPQEGNVEEVITKLLMAGAEICDREKQNSVITIREIVQQKIPQLHDLKYRTTRGAWSEKRGCDIDRNGFVGLVPGWLMEECSEADDAPHDAAGAITRTSLLRAIQTELQVLWSDIIERLPSAPEADLKPDGEAATAFRQALINLWTATRTFRVSKSENETVASRASLISRVLQDARGFLNGDVVPSGGWRPVQIAFSAWWRPVILASGEISVALAMRAELCGQIGVTLPGVTTQGTLTALADKFKLMDKSGVPGKTSKGKSRITVLSERLTAELLEDPTRGDADDQEVSPGQEAASPVSPNGFKHEHKNGSNSAMGDAGDAGNSVTQEEFTADERPF